MKENLRCPKCSKSNGLWVSFSLNAFLRTKLNSSGEIETSESLEKLIGAESVFSYYASNNDETKVFLLSKEDNDEKLVSIYCNRCSNVFQIKKSSLRYQNEQ